MYKPLATPRKPLSFQGHPTPRILSPIETILSVFGSTLAFWCATFLAWSLGTTLGHSLATSNFNPYDLISAAPLTLLLIPFMHPLGFLFPLLLITTFVIGVYSESPKLRLTLLTFILLLAALAAYLFFNRFN